MEVYFQVDESIKFTTCNTVFLFQVMLGEVVNRSDYQGYQFGVHFIRCQKPTDILQIVNEFIQYVQNYFQYVYTRI